MFNFIYSEELELFRSKLFILSLSFFYAIRKASNYNF